MQGPDEPALETAAERYILARHFGEARPRGWVRPGLTVRIVKLDRLAGGRDVGCYHVKRDGGRTLCGRRTDGRGWRDAGWGDSEVLCCKTCARWLWSRWLRVGACDGLATDQRHTLAPEDDWVSRLSPAGGVGY